MLLLLRKHTDLRDPSYSHLFDVKHIKKHSIPLFAANIKSGVRHAHGIPNRNRNKVNHGDRSHSHPTINYQLGLDAPKKTTIGNRMKAIAGYVKPNNYEIINRVIDALKGLLR